jgi:hypothetical protein
MVVAIIILDEDEDGIDPEVLEALDWFWTEEYEDYLKKLKMEDANRRNI